MMLLVIVTTAASEFERPPPLTKSSPLLSLLEWLFVTVVLYRVSGPYVVIPPPSPSDLFPLTVEFTSAVVPKP